MKTKRLFAVVACVLLVVTLLCFFLPMDVKASGRSGGPDSFGYTFADSNTPGGPTYDWIEISGTGTDVLSNSDDAVSSATALGFFFNFYGTDYSSIAIANNGLLFAAGTIYQYHNDPITQSSGVHGFLAPLRNTGLPDAHVA